MSAARNAEPIPKATTSARDESGRAMSGRIGISFASTVSNVIDVPPTQSSGVKVACPAWTDAISSSVEAKMLAPTGAEIGLVGLDEQARDEWGRRDEQGHHQPDRHQRPTGDASSGMPARYRARH